MAKKKKIIVVVFSLVKYRRLGDFKYKIVGISADIDANTTIFVTPVPTVASVNGHLVDLDGAQALVQQRVPGGVATRNAAYNVVLVDIRSWLRYVQDLIDKEPDPEQQMIIATSSGFDIKVNGAINKPDLKVVQTGPNTVKLVARSAASRAAYSWQMSINNGTTWTDLPVTNAAKTTVSGLTAGTRYVFRFRSTVKNVVSNWSYTVSIVIQFPAT